MQLTLRNDRHSPLGLYRVTKSGMTLGLSACLFLKLERYNRNGDK